MFTDTPDSASGATKWTAMSTAGVGSASEQPARGATKWTAMSTEYLDPLVKLESRMATIADRGQTRHPADALGQRAGDGCPADADVPAGLHRRIPVQHRHLDAERGPGRAGLRPHRIVVVRGLGAVRPARPDAVLLDRGWAAGRHLRPPPVADRGLGHAGGARPRLGRGDPRQLARTWRGSSPSCS